MSLSPGTRLGPYEITDLLGSGGMGEVYRARDTKLGREVAIKILPELFAADPERVARFTREAKTLAALNHPHIAQVYGLEESPSTGAGPGPVRALVMELVEGETLAERIAHGPIPVADALPIARQIAEALEAAHELGIIHRDLKPANVKVRPDGTVKVLDFGLAKALDPRAGTAEAAALGDSPTITSPAAMTRAGVILGTAAYMSPEQAKGRPVDRRADIWAFGCVLFEMLTGRRAFPGDDVSETLAAVLKSDPQWTLLPAETPTSIRRLLRRCLVKDLRKRLHDIADAGLELEDALGGAAEQPVGGPPPRTLRRERLTWGVAVVTLALVAVAALAMLRPRPAPTPGVVRFSVAPPEGTVFGSGTSSDPNWAQFAISPDGRRLALGAREPGGPVSLWIRAVEALAAQPLPGTEGAGMPFWSPDSRWVGFFAQGKLKKIDVTGGPAQILCDALSGRGGAWSPDGVIVFAPDQFVPLSRVSASGGAAVPVTTLAPPQTSHRYPAFLPDGRHFVYTSSGTSVEILLGGLDSPDATSLLEADAAALFAPPGFLLFPRQGALLAQVFDPNTLRLSGDAVPVVERVMTSTPAVAASVSANGTLVYRAGPGTQDPQLAWVDRAGRVVESVGTPGPYYGVAVSPDGKKVAVHRHEGPGGDIWLVESPGPMTRLTFDATQDNCCPVWSPDGTRVAFESLRAGKWGIYQKLANGTGPEEPLLQSDSNGAMAWSRDGRFLVYRFSAPKTGLDVWALPLTGDRTPFPVVEAPANQFGSAISPDGKWIAYISTESGRGEVYVKPFPTGDGRWQITTQGAATASSVVRWRGDSQEVFYLTPDYATMTAVPVTASGLTFQAGAPKALFDTHYTTSSLAAHGYTNFAVTPDGQRFLIAQAGSGAPPITVVVNWQAGLKK